MSVTYNCRLCLNSCTEFKSLYNETGQTNEIYDLAVKYFQTEYLQVDQRNTMRNVLCWECWRTMEGFQQFQLTVFDKHQKLLTQELELVCLTQKNTDEDDHKHDIASDGNSLEDEKVILPLSDNKFIAHDDSQPDIGDAIPSFRLLNKWRCETIAKWKETLECDICGYSAAYYKTLLRHFERNHPKERCYVKCCECKISGLAAIAKHARFHMQFHLTEKQESETQYLFQKTSDDHKHDIASDVNTQEDEKVIPPLSDNKFIAHDDSQPDIGDAIPSFRLLNKWRCETIAKWKGTLECDICGYSAAYYKTLLRHFERNHPKERCYVKCCKRKISGLAAIEKHARFHMSTGDVQYIASKAPLEVYNQLSGHQEKKHPKQECSLTKCDLDFHMKRLKYHSGTNSLTLIWRSNVNLFLYLFISAFIWSITRLCR